MRSTSFQKLVVLWYNGCYFAELTGQGCPTVSVIELFFLILTTCFTILEVKKKCRYGINQHTGTLILFHSGLALWQGSLLRRPKGCIRRGSAKHLLYRSANDIVV